MVESGNGGRRTDRATPTITSIDVGSPAKKDLNDVVVTFTGSNVKSRTSIEIDAIHINSIVEQLLDAMNVAFACHKEKLHRGIEILRHRHHLRLAAKGLGAPSDRIERRLAAEAEPHVVTARVERGLACELPA